MADLKTALRDRILVIDGAMGTQIQDRDLSAADFGGDDLEGCNENLVFTRPDVIKDIHAAYLEAGADIIETNTFGATSVVLAEYGLEAKARELNRVAARLAREAADAAATPERPRFVAGSIGPTTKTISVTGGVTFDALRVSYKEQALGLVEGGADALLIETTQDTLNLKAATLGVNEALAELGKTVPIMVSLTIEPMGTMLAGQGVEAAWAALEHLDLVSVGLNCATGPEFMADHLRTLAGVATVPVTVYPNAGLPDENGEYDETPQSLAAKLERFVVNGWVNAIGGCCGTTPEHTRAIAAVAAGRKPRAPPVTAKRLVSGIEALEITDDPNQRPILVGERTNVIGSRKFKRLVAAGEWEQASEVGRAQVKAGAQVVDVCLADPDRDEVDDMEAFLPLLVKKVKAPVMIDSTDADVIERSLKHLQGKAIINSVNLEDAEERFEKVCPLARRFGAALVVGTIDEDKEQGMAVTAERKLEVAERSYRLLTERYGIPGRDIIFDPLVFPAGTGDANYIGSAAATIEGVRLITERFPDASTILGISNVSFGLPPAGREILNAVFLYECVQAGLTFAIVNSQGIARYALIPPEERALAEDVIFNRGDDPIAAFTAHFRDRKVDTGPKKEDLPLDERLARCIVEGTKEGLVADLDLKRQDTRPLDIINGPLMTGMAEVGRLFNDNQLIVAEVLQSAEAMKAAVAHLEQFMEKSSDANKGTVLLATVKGDVHDIGKNLVEIILGNNGFRVVNLGIKVPPEDLIAAVRKHTPDAIGLSGLLVKSAQQMVITAQDLKTAGIDVPMLVGGAALSKRFTGTRIAPEYGAPVLYAKDAMNGLDLANQLLGAADTRAALLASVRAEQATMQAAPKKTVVANTAVAAPTPLAHDFVLPRPPDFKRHALRNVDLTDVWRYLNPLMLFSKHLGLKGDIDKLVAKNDEKAIKLKAVVDDLKAEILRDGLMRADGVYRYFPAAAEGNDLVVFDPDAPGDKVLETFHFQRQSVAPYRCLTDFTRPRASGDIDSVAFFVVTAGSGIRDRVEAYKEQGEFLKSHALGALALETAEAFAERVHQRIRGHWGIPDDPTWPARDLFKGKYRGVRVSFGYPACPDLSDQEKLFRILNPEDVGVALTEGFMMDPEASVSALVFHHPEGTYFNV